MPAALNLGRWNHDRFDSRVTIEIHRYTLSHFPEMQHNLNQRSSLMEKAYMQIDPWAVCLDIKASRHKHPCSSRAVKPRVAILLHHDETSRSFNIPKLHNVDSSWPQDSVRISIKNPSLFHWLTKTPTEICLTSRRASSRTFHPTPDHSYMMTIISMIFSFLLSPLPSDFCLARSMWGQEDQALDNAPPLSHSDASQKHTEN